MCEDCAAVQEENPIVSEVQFGESTSGAAIVQGSMVGPNQTRAYSHGSALESKDQTIARALYKMNIIAQVMKIPKHVVDSAYNWFKVAYHKNFVKGRRSQNVIAACLYIACRKAKEHHLLIDFSSRLQISVYSLGATFLKLVRILDISMLEPADASLFIEHFAEKLGFGDQTTKVCNDATELAKRMNADWICYGRRPAGIAGACLLLAARMNNFQRSHTELVAVSHVAEETIQRRLNEFKKTSPAKLTILDFRDAASEPQYFESSDAKPPSFNRNKEIEKKVQKVLRQRTRTLERYRELAKGKQLLNSLDIIGGLHPLERDPTDDGHTGDDNESKILKTVDDISPATLGLSSTDISEPSRRRMSSRNSAKKLKVEPDEQGNPKKETASDQNENDNSSDEETNDLFVPRKKTNGVDAGDDDEDFGFDDLPDAPLDDGDDDDYLEPKRKSSCRIFVDKKPVRSGRLEGLEGSISVSRPRLEGLSSSAVPRRRMRRQEENNLVTSEKDGRLNELLKAILDGGSLKEEDVERALDAILQKNKHNDKNETAGVQSQVEDHLRIMMLHCPRNLVKNSPTSEEILKKVRDNEELDELDDDEEVIDFKLLEEEAKQKERMWIAINHDFLISQEKKRLKLVADELAGNASGQVKKRRNVIAKAVPSIDELRQALSRNTTMSPADSTRKMLQKKAYSKKINYDIFPNLFLEQAGH